MTTDRVLALLLICLICGCTKTVRHQVAEYYPGSAPTTQPVPRTAVYSIRFIDAEGKKFGGIASSHVYVKRGDPIGFALEEGKLRGIAGSYNFSIDAPANHGLVWSATDRRPTQFGKEVARAVGVAGRAAFVVTVSGILVVGFMEGKITPFDLLRSDDEWSCRPSAVQH